MPITQTIEVPADRRIILKVPREVPTGTVILTFTPPQTVKKPITAEEEKAAINRIAARLKVEMADVLEMQSCHPEDVGV